MLIPGRRFLAFGFCKRVATYSSMTKKWKHHKIDKTFLQDQKERSVHGEYGWLDRKKGTIVNSVCRVSRSFTIRSISKEITRTGYRYGGAPTPNRGSITLLLFAEVIEMRQN